MLPLIVFITTALAVYAGILSMERANPDRPRAKHPGLKAVAVGLVAAVCIALVM